MFSVGCRHVWACPEASKASLPGIYEQEGLRGTLGMRENGGRGAQTAGLQAMGWCWKEASELSRKCAVQELSFSWLTDPGEGGGYMTESESNSVEDNEHKGGSALGGRTQSAMEAAWVRRHARLRCNRQHCLSRGPGPLLSGQSGVPGPSLWQEADSKRESRR